MKKRKTSHGSYGFVDKNFSYQKQKYFCAPFSHCKALSSVKDNNLNGIRIVIKNK